METLASNTVNAFAPFYLSKPGLCLSCKKNDIEDWDDSGLSCLFQEALKESTDGYCQAYEPMW